MKRRHFSAGLAAGIVLAGTGLALSAQAKPATLPYMQKQAFAARLNQPVSIRAASSDVFIQAQLAAVDSTRNEQQFYVRFATQQPEDLAEDLYLLKMQDGREVLLHLMPSASDKNTLEAVINQSVG